MIVGHRGGCASSLLDHGVKIPAGEAAGVAALIMAFLSPDYKNNVMITILEFNFFVNVGRNSGQQELETPCIGVSLVMPFKLQGCAGC